MPRTVTVLKSWKLFWDLWVGDGKESADHDPVAPGSGEHDGLGDLAVGGDVAVVVLDVAVVAADDDQIDAGVRLAAFAVVGERFS